MAPRLYQRVSMTPILDQDQRLRRGDRSSSAARILGAGPRTAAPPQALMPCRAAPLALRLATLCAIVLLYACHVAVCASSDGAIGGGQKQKPGNKQDGEREREMLSVMKPRDPPRNSPDGSPSPSSPANNSNGVGTGGGVPGSPSANVTWNQDGGAAVPGAEKGAVVEDDWDCMYRSKGIGRKLHRCALGYAGLAKVTGGLYQPLYIVNRSDDSLTNIAPGTLRYAVSAYAGGVWIRFARSMTIFLRERLFLRSRTTIDGRGADVRLVNNGLVIENVENVIVHNVQVRSQWGDHDIIPIRSSKRVWIDHLFIGYAKRGSVDVVYGSTDVTISNCLIQNRNLTMLLGAADNDTRDIHMRVTVYRNWFRSCGQRQPAVRWGQVHVANNLYTSWGYYCVGGRAYANIRSEQNVYYAGPVRKEVTPWFGPNSTKTVGFDNTPTIVSIRDLLVKNATFHQFRGRQPPFTPPYYLPMHRADFTLMNFVKKNSGPLLSNFPVMKCNKTVCNSPPR